MLAADLGEIGVLRLDGRRGASSSFFQPALAAEPGVVARGPGPRVHSESPRSAAPTWLQQLAPGGRLRVPQRFKGTVSRSIAYEQRPGLFALDTPLNRIAVDWQ